MNETANKQTQSFQTEVSRVLDLVVHSLYSNKEIFLRELISNASDANDKLRFKAMSKYDLYEDDSELKIWVNFDEKARTITVRDNGIGMNRDEVIENLGTIAKSGTNEFFKQLTGDQSKDSQLIGQFGVGFYAGFIIADKVTVRTRRAGESADQGVEWESTGTHDFTVESINKPARGTEIILHLKAEEDEFLSDYRLKEIIKKYSNHVNWPIVMSKVVEVSNEEEEEEKDAATEGDDNKSNDSEKTEANKKPKETKIEEEVVNSANALWTLSKSEISSDQYNEFYKHISHDFDNPLAWSHNKVEGKHEYTTLLYIPKRAPFDLWQPDNKHGLKLFVKRVFIMDDADQFLPKYMRFIKGVVDANDLPLNISREILQDNKLVDTIRSGVIKRVLSKLEKLAENEPEEYKTFWDAFGLVLKEGPIEDFTNKERIAKLLRFSSTHDDKDTPEVSLQDYVSRMKEDQTNIYYITAESFNAAKNSPHLEIFRKKGIEVLLLHDRIDEWLVSHLSEFDGKHLQSASKGEIDLDDSEEEKSEEIKKAEESFGNVIEQMKKVLEDKVKDVRITHRLTSSPACLVADAHDMGREMQRILEAAGQKAPEAKPIFEVNMEHPFLQRLKTETDDERFSEWTHILFDQAILAEGGHLPDAATFVARLNKVLLQLSS